MDGKGGGSRGSTLAARFRQALADRTEAERGAAEAAEREAVAGQRARGELLQELEQMALELPGVRAERSGEALTLRYGDRAVGFVPEGERDRVRVEGIEGEVAALFRQPELAHLWVFSRSRRGREDRVPLFDLGLEHLLVKGLGLPEPGEASEVEAAPEVGPVAPGPSRRL